MTKQNQKQTENLCENCEKVIKDNEEIFEINDKYVCQSCMEDSNTQAELLVESHNEENFIGESK